MARCAERKLTMHAEWLLLAACSIAASVPSQAQSRATAPEGTTAKAPEYEIVSIKPDKLGNRGGSMQSLPDGFRWINFPVASWIRGAYGIIMDSQVSGMPGWADSEPYDIETKADAETAEAWKSLSYKDRWKQEQPMLQSLLADRCKLKVHRETRETPVYDLVIAKGGLKIKEAPADEKDAEMMTAGKMTAHALSMDNLVYGFSGVVGRIIVDKTGLAGKKFDFELTWSPDEQPNVADTGPSIFAALEEQLGLKLVPSREPVETLVIDHIERPSPN